MDLDSSNRNWWHDGVAFFFEISGWLAVPVVVALLLGHWLDQYFQTKPFLTLLMIGIAFLGTISVITRRGMKLMKKLNFKIPKK